MLPLKIKRKVSYPLIFFAGFSLILDSPCYASGLVADFLSDLGKTFYERGNIPDALHEFKKALLLDPNQKTALEYIKLIEAVPPTEPTVTAPKAITPLPAVQPAITPPPLSPPPTVAPPSVELEKPPKKDLFRERAIDKEVREQLKVKPPTEAAPPKKALIGKLFLDGKVKTTQPDTKVEIELDRALIVVGKAISRFLIVSPDVLSAEKISPDELKIKGKRAGISYIHIWDKEGRWTLNVFSVYPKPEGITLEEQLRLEEEKASSFKLEYGLNWNLFESGKRIDELNRKSYQYTHILGLEGQTPYGKLDSKLHVRRLGRLTDLTSVTIGLKEASWGSFKDFEVRGFDYSPGVSNLTYTDVGLRGLMLKSPAFNKKLVHKIFWGREGGGAFGGLSPGLAKVRDSFISGFDLNYTLSKNSNYGVSVVHGWGPQRSDILNPYNYDFRLSHLLGDTRLRYEIAHDSETFGHIINAEYSRARLKLGSRLRNIDKDFVSATAIGSERGLLGGLFFADYSPTDNLNISNRLDVFRDRAFPSLDNDKRWNQNYDFEAQYEIDKLTSIKPFYRLQNELGRLSQFRSHAGGVTLSRYFEKFIGLSTFINYQHQESKFFASLLNNHINDKIVGGIRFRLIDDIYYYINKEFNWLNERSFNNTNNPEALETGLDWYGNISKSISGNFRIIYRDEENTVSNLSFLSGEDYLEGSGELSFRPNADTEIYCSGRVRNIWADNPNVNERIDLDLRAGMRYKWDTKLRWESVGTIDGYVFKDYDMNSLKDNNEPGISNIKLWLGKNRTETTDANGYYRFKKVRAKKAYVAMDTASIPSGFTLTTKQAQSAEIVHGRSVRVDFGIASQTEISGVVFYDKDGDGQFGSGDIGIKDIILRLEDGTKISTDNFGKFFLRKLSPGEHALTLEINSVPPQYIPQVPLTKKITLLEGTRFVYNLPFKQTRK